MGKTFTLLKMTLLLRFQIIRSLQKYLSVVCWDNYNISNLAQLNMNIEDTRRVYSGHCVGQWTGLVYGVLCEVYHMTGFFSLNILIYYFFWKWKPHQVLSMAREIAKHVLVQRKKLTCLVVICNKSNQRNLYCVSKTRLYKKIRQHISKLREFQHFLTKYVMNKLLLRR